MAGDAAAGGSAFAQRGGEGDPDTSAVWRNPLCHRYARAPIAYQHLDRNDWMAPFVRQASPGPSSRHDGEDLSRAFWTGTIRPTGPLCRRRRGFSALTFLAAAGGSVFSGPIAANADHALSHHGFSPGE